MEWCLFLDIQWAEKTALWSKKATRHICMLCVFAAVVETFLSSFVAVHLQSDTADCNCMLCVFVAEVEASATLLVAL